ncbi:MAG: hypothetical protein ABI605_10480 [Rhizobacter sp.]
MSKAWKILALLLAITALVWLTTMWRWQSAQTDPSSADLVLKLVALPVILTATLVGAVWAITRLRTYATAPTIVPAAAATPVNTAVNSTGSATVNSTVNERNTHFRLLGSAVQIRAGRNWSSAQSSMASGECKPELDAQLKDDDGVAMFTAPMPDLATDRLADALLGLSASLAQAKPEIWAGYEAPTEVLRALTLLDMAASAMQASVEAQWPTLSALPPSPRNNNAVTPSLPPSVSIRVAIPARWSPQSQQLAGAWLEKLFDPSIEAGLKAAGQSRAMAHNTRPAVQLHLHAVDSGEAFWLLTDQQLLQWQRDGEAGLLWVLAADSLVSESDTAAMAATQELFSGRNQRGRVPGEGAAALLLASPAWLAPLDAEPPQAHLHRANVMRRDKSADASGRVGPQTVLQAATDALQASGWQPAQIEHLTTDADHRASRTGEVYEALLDLLPDLDTGEQALRLGLGCGDLGVARLLACVALAASQVQESQAPGLVLGAFPAFERFAVVVAPPAAHPDTAVAAPAQPSA